MVKFFLLIFSLGILGCATNSNFISPEDIDFSKDITPLEYRIGELDILDISVWQWPDLHKEVIVRPDGKISFPLVGDIEALGLTLTELDKILTERLTEYIRNPEVSVMLKKFGGKKVIVLGEVKSPGVYRVSGIPTVLEVMAMAGGYTEHAVLNSVIIIRGSPQKPLGIRVNLTKALKRADLKQNVFVQPDDIIYVPKKFIANVNYFVKQVVGPIYESAYTLYTLQSLETPIFKGIIKK